VSTRKKRKIKNPYGIVARIMRVFQKKYSEMNSFPWHIFEVDDSHTYKCCLWLQTYSSINIALWS
jgi:hypothetical protein